MMCDMFNSYLKLSCRCEFLNVKFITHSSIIARQGFPMLNEGPILIHLSFSEPRRMRMYKCDFHHMLEYSRVRCIYAL